MKDGKKGKRHRLPWHHKVKALVQKWHARCVCTLCMLIAAGPHATDRAVYWPWQGPRHRAVYCGQACCKQATAGRSCRPPICCLIAVEGCVPRVHHAASSIRVQRDARSSSSEAGLAGNLQNQVVHAHVSRTCSCAAAAIVPARHPQPSPCRIVSTSNNKNYDKHRQLFLTDDKDHWPLMRTACRTGVPPAAWDMVSTPGAHVPPHPRVDCPLLTTECMVRRAPHEQRYQALQLSPQLTQWVGLLLLHQHQHRNRELLVSTPHRPTTCVAQYRDASTDFSRRQRQRLQPDNPITNR